MVKVKKTFLKDKAYGMVLFKKTEGKLKVLVVQHKDRHFSLPKGHKKFNESNWEAALRELQEESGIEKLFLLLPYKIRENYKFQKNNNWYHKEVIYFIGMWAGGSLNVRKGKNDVVKAFWIDIDQVKKFLFPSSLKVIQQSVKILNKAYEKY